MNTDKIKKQAKKHLPFDTGKRIKRTASLGNTLAPSIQKAFAKRGINDMRLVQRWNHIVGDDYARLTMLERITYTRDGMGTVHISTVGAVATELSHQFPYIIARINMYLGQGAISKVKTHQTLSWDYMNMKQNVSEIKCPPPPRTDVSAIETIDNTDIKNCLRRIAGFVYNKD